MKLMTKVLIGPALDHAVAVCENVDVAVSGVYPNGSRSVVTFYGLDEEGFLDGRSYKPSEHWGDGGPIIEREQISVQHLPGAQCWIVQAEPCWQASLNGDHVSYGPTPLVAAMRCLVASQLGQFVDTPAELALDALVAAQSQEQGMDLFHAVCDGAPPSGASENPLSSLAVGWLFRIRAGAGRGPWVYSEKPVLTRGCIEAVQAIGLPHPLQQGDTNPVSEGFEVWAARNAYPLAKMPDGTFQNIGTMARWEAWRDALRSLGYEFE